MTITYFIAVSYIIQALLYLLYTIRTFFFFVQFSKWLAIFQPILLFKEIRSYRLTPLTFLLGGSWWRKNISFSLRRVFYDGFFIGIVCWLCCQCLSWRFSPAFTHNIIDEFVIFWLIFKFFSFFYFHHILFLWFCLQFWRFRVSWTDLMMLFCFSKISLELNAFFFRVACRLAFVYEIISKLGIFFIFFLGDGLLLRWGLYFRISTAHFFLLK